MGAARVRLLMCIGLSIGVAFTANLAKGDVGSQSGRAQSVRSRRPSQPCRGHANEQRRRTRAPQFQRVSCVWLMRPALFSGLVT
jgi:hypothetical protein